MNRPHPDMTAEQPSSAEQLSVTAPSEAPEMAEADTASSDESSDSGAEPLNTPAQSDDSAAAQGDTQVAPDTDSAASTEVDAEQEEEPFYFNESEEMPLSDEAAAELAQPGPDAVRWAEDDDEDEDTDDNNGADQSSDSEEKKLPAEKGESAVAASSDFSDDDDDPKPEDDEPMTLLGHLAELRRRLTRIVIAVLLGFFACYSISEPVYDFLLLPLKQSLPESGKLIYTSPQGLFFVYMKLALLTSVFATSPYGFYQIWAFIAPGLYREEKKAILPLSLFSAFFFIAGAAFCYITVFPLAFKFFMGFATDIIVPMISVEEYLSFVLKLLIAFGLVFEMPLFSYFLSRFGLLTPDMMRRHRKYAILGIFIIAAILTPPDVISQCLMALPMMLLYEVSVYVSKIARPVKNSDKKKEEKAGKADEKQEAKSEDKAEEAPASESENAQADVKDEAPEEGGAKAETPSDAEQPEEQSAADKENKHD